MSEVVELGQLTLGACVPTALAAVGVADASIALTLPQLEAQVAGLLELQASLVITPPSIAASIALAQQLIVSLQAALTLPGAELNLSAIAAAIAALQVTMGGLQAQLALVAGLSLTLGTPGIWAFARTGPVGTFGQDFAAEFGGGLPDSGDPNLPTYALVFIASDAGAIEAMQTVFAS